MPGRRGRPDDRVAGTAIGAVDERIAVAAVGRIEQLTQAVGTDIAIGGDLHFAPRATALPYHETALVGRRYLLPPRGADDGQGWGLLRDRAPEAVHLLIASLRLQQHAGRGVHHPTGQPVAVGQPVDEGAEAYPLHYPFDVDPDPLDGSSAPVAAISWRRRRATRTRDPSPPRSCWIRRRCLSAG